MKSAKIALSERELLIKKIRTVNTDRGPSTQAPDLWKEQLQQQLEYAARFLDAMRKLQRVVHRKEQNVSVEKTEFERAKKDLESHIKSLTQAL